MRETLNAFPVQEGHDMDETNDANQSSDDVRVGLGGISHIGSAPLEWSRSRLSQEGW